jgi:hypothetical protein
LCRVIGFSFDRRRAFFLATFLAFSCSLSAQTELLMHLKLDETMSRNGSILRDSSPNGNDAIVTNNNGSAHKSVNGVNDLALHFDGSGDRADGQAFVGKHTSNGANQLLVGIYQGGYHVNLQGQQFTGGADELSTDWQHIVVTAVSPGANGAGSTDVRFYKDGWPLWTNTVNAVVGDVSGGKGWTLGQDWDGASTTSDFFTGDMDDVAIFNGALSGGRTTGHRQFDSLEQPPSTRRGHATIIPVGRRRHGYHRGQYRSWIQRKRRELGRRTRNGWRWES